jgi:uncharacterized membrane protein YuzA (DUF378 family)
MQKHSALDWIALLLVVVGGLNWGLVGLLEFDLVNWLFVQVLSVEILATIVYVLVGLSAIYVLVKAFSAKK